MTDFLASPAHSKNQANLGDIMSDATPAHLPKPTNLTLWDPSFLPALPFPSLPFDWVWFWFASLQFGLSGDPLLWRPQWQFASLATTLQGILQRKLSGGMFGSFVPHSNPHQLLAMYTSLLLMMMMMILLLLILQGMKRALRILILAARNI